MDMMLVIAVMMESRKVRNLQFVFLIFMFLPGYCFAEMDTYRQQQLKHLLKHDCGSCHGLTLQGGLGPALTPKRLSMFPREFLVNSITYGRTGTPMPPWGPILSQEEINWLVDYMLHEEKE
jgi:cytochrome c55X